MKKIKNIVFFLGIFQCLYSQDYKSNLDVAIEKGGDFSTINNNFDLKNKVLIERGGDYSMLKKFHDSVNSIDYTFFKQSLLDLYLASNKTDFESIEKFYSRLETKKEYLDEIHFGVIHSDFESINFDFTNDDTSSNSFILEEGALIAKEGFEYFTKHKATLVSPLTDKVLSSSVDLVFDNEFFYFNNIESLYSVELDFGDFKYELYKNGEFKEGRKNLTFAKSQLKSFAVKIIYTDGSFKTYNSTFEVEIGKISNDGSSRFSRSNKIVNKASENSLIKPYRVYGNRDNQIVSTKYFKDYDSNFEAPGVLSYKLYSSNKSSSYLENPVIIVDGFDPGNKRDLKRESKELKYGNKYLVDILNSNGYDVLICNFINYKFNGKNIDGGAGYIERNAYALIDLIHAVNRTLEKHNSQNQIKILGPSMGGLISRYALAYMEKNNLEHNVDYWVSFDSPHHGAHIPLSVQSALYMISDESVIAKEKWNHLLKSTAAKQMLINQIDPKRIQNQTLLRSEKYTCDPSFFNGRTEEQGFNTNGGSTFFQKFYKNLYSNGIEGSKGFPTKTVNLNIVNGSIDGLKTGNNSENVINVAVRGKWSNKTYATLNCWSQPYNGQNYNFSHFYRVLNNDYFILKNESDRSNLDIVSGGVFNAYNEIVTGFVKEESNRFRKVDVTKNKKTHTFIPTFSSLALKDPKRNWSKSLSFDILSDTDKELTYFDAYFAPSRNEYHTQLTEQNVNWVLNIVNKQLDKDEVRSNLLNEVTYLDSNSINESKVVSSKIVSTKDLTIFKDQNLDLLANEIKIKPNFIARHGSKISIKTVNQEYVSKDLLTYNNEKVFLESGLNRKTRKNKNEYVNLDDNVFEIKEGYTFYPNPAIERIYLNKEVEEVSIFDLNGSLLIKKQNSLNIDVTSLINGVYIIQTKNKENELKINKLIISK